MRALLFLSRLPSDRWSHPRWLAIATLVALVGGCSGAWNDPYPMEERGKAILYGAFSERPKHLDPAQAYASDEYEIISQIYEPPLQYHYLKRPYTLIPGTLEKMPEVSYFDAGGRRLANSANPQSIAYSEYELRIRPGIQYAPHPAFAIIPGGGPAYLSLAKNDLGGKTSLADFPLRGTRELTARDYIYQIKRLAHPRVHSPILGHMSEYIIGLKEYSERLVAAIKKSEAGRGRGVETGYLDLNQFDISGVIEVDRYVFRIRVKGKYPQFSYWLAMPFFAPLPVEADRFYSQAGMAEKNITLDWYPVGTGPFFLAENNPNARMVLERNPYFRGEAYPAEGEPADRAMGLLGDAGQMAPFLDKIVLTREREGIPYWNKFLQGYYDQSGISNDNFDNAVRMSSTGESGLSESMERSGIQLRTSVATSTYYLAFNWLDSVVGGQGDPAQRERARKLRQAISIAVDFDEFISIFANGRGIPGQGPIPPGIFGFREGDNSLNEVVYEKRGGKFMRRSIDEAKRLLAEAGYAGGRDQRTGQPLVLYLDTTARGPGDKSRLDWYRRQFQKVDIQLDIRATDWNRFQEKVRKGNTQLFFLGWNADYPDPENFLFLLYGPNSAVKANGENKSNFQNDEFDRLFEQMKHLENGAQRQELIDRMVKLLRHQSPWLWGFHPKDYGLYHSWLSNVKPNQMARNGMKFYRVDAELRDSRRSQWNKPMLWPLAVLLLFIALAAIPAWRSWRERDRRQGLNVSAGSVA